MSTPLSRAHIEGERRLREFAALGVGRVWRGLPGYDEQNVDQFLTLALPLVAAAQRQSVALTEAFLARSMRRQPLGVPASDIVDAVRPGVLMAEVYHRPFVTVWSALSSGTKWEDAVAQGLARATSTAATDVQMAMREAAAQVQHADERIAGYRRVADAGACAFCQEVDGAFIKSAEAMPLHNHCGCGIEPLTEPGEPTPVPDTVAVHEHGELGPVLADPLHDFTPEGAL